MRGIDIPRDLRSKAIRSEQEQLRAKMQENGEISFEIYGETP